MIKRPLLSCKAMILPPPPQAPDDPKAKEERSAETHSGNDPMAHKLLHSPLTLLTTALCAFRILAPETLVQRRGHLPTVPPVVSAPAKRRTPPASLAGAMAVRSTRR